jgi:hypothetical protein
MTTPQQAGQLSVNTRYHWLTFMLSAFAPKATINGHPVKLAWGQNHLPAPPGRHLIEIWVPYLWSLGRASMTVDNTHGTPQVYYAAPVWTWMRGAIGTSEVKSPGLMGALIVYAILAVGIVACCIGVLISGGGSGS